MTCVWSELADKRIEPDSYVRIKVNLHRFYKEYSVVSCLICMMKGLISLIRFGGKTIKAEK